MANLLPNTLDVQIVRMVKALYDAAPGSTYLSALRGTGSVAAASETLNANFASLTNVQWAQRIVDNLHMTGAVATEGRDYLVAQLGQPGVTRANLLPSAMTGLAGLESNAVFGAAALYFNNSTATAYEFSISTNPANATTNLAILMLADEPNTAPVAGADSASATEGGGVIAGTVAANDSDAQNDALSFALAVNQAPVAGLSFGSNGTYTFDPTNAAYNDIRAGQTRAVAVTYTVTDGELSTNGTLTITVTGTNDAPTAAAVFASGAEDSASIAVTPSSTDPDTGDTAAYAVVSNPSNGTVVFSGGAFNYVPNANFNGTDSFTYRVTDGSGATSVATASITVTAVNDAPVAANSSAAGVEDNAVGGTVTGTDTEGSSLTFAVATGPANGSVVLNANGSYVYTPVANFNGTDSFTFTANDGLATSAPRTVTITVTPANDAPVAAAVFATGAEDAASIAVAPSSSDIDVGDSATYSVNSQPANGSVTWNAGTGRFSYVPNLNFNGTDTFTYKVTDSAGAASVAIASVTVQAVNDAPVAAPLSATGFEDTAVVGQVGATDVDGDALSYSVATGPTNGTVTMNANGSFIYNPASNYFGPDSFTYSVTDGKGGTATAVVTLSLAQVADALTTGIDISAGSIRDDIWQGNQFTLNAGDSLDGGAGTDKLVVNVGAGGTTAFASFVLRNVEEFEITNDAGAAVSFDMSSSTGVKTLRDTNSTFDARFNFANTNPDSNANGFDEVNLEVLNLTAGVSVTLDIRNDDAPGNDELNLTVNDSDNDNLDVNQINIIAEGSALGGPDQTTASGIEMVNLTTAGTTGNVRINDLNTPGSTVLNISTASGLTIGDTDANLAAFENALSSTINSVQAAGATGNIALSTEDNDTSVTINLGSGSDTVATGDGPDTVNAGAGNDSVRAGSGNDSITGGTGNDTIAAGEGHNSVDAGDDNDVVTAGAGWDTITGGTGADNISAGNGNNVVTGGTGNDTIVVGSGDDNVDAGDDNDNIDFSAGGFDAINAGNGNDVMNAGTGLDSSYNEFVFPGAGTDQVDGGAGSDTLNLSGDSGDANELDSVRNVEQINLAGEDYSISVTDGAWFDTDTTATTVSATTITGTLFFNGNDGGVGGSGFGGDGPFNSIGAFDDGVLSRAITVLGGNQNDTISTGLGADSIAGNGGNDIISSGAGNDTVEQGSGTDNVNLGSGNDIAIVGTGQLDATDTISGDPGVAPGVGTDIIQFNIVDNNGVFAGDNSSATLDAGISNIDTLLVNDLDGINGDGHTVLVTLNAGYSQNALTIDATSLDSDEGLNVQAGLNAANENLTVLGGEGSDYVDMGDNLNTADSIDGNNGYDYLQAVSVVDADFTNVAEVEQYHMGNNAGDTAVLGAEAQEAGIRTVVDLNGNDVINASGYTTGLTVYVRGGADTVTTGSGNDTVYDQAGTNDTINTGAGNDRIYTDGGDDLIDAGTGADTVDGLAGNDSVSGNDGDDVIIGYGNQVTGADTISGGLGNDTLELNDGLGNVTAVIALPNVTSIDNITAVDSDNDGLGNVANVTNIAFVAGSVATLTTVNVNGRGFGGNAYGTGGDALNVDLSAIGDKDYAFNITGGLGNDTVTGSSLPENLNFQAGGGNDRLNVDATDLGTTLTMAGGAGTDTINMLSGALTDDSFDNITGVEHLTANGGGQALNAQLGARADAALDETTLGYITVTGTTGDDMLLLDPAFNDDVRVNLSAGGNDSVNGAGASSRVVVIADVSDIDVNDVISGGTGAADALWLAADNGTANPTNVTRVESYVITENGDNSATLNLINANFTGVGSGVISVNGAQLDDSTDAEGGSTINAGGITVGALNVITGTGADSITTGSGNDTIDAGADYNLLFVTAANDTVDSGAGADLITTRSGNDSIVAGSGNDTVDAGNGNNTVWGGTGNDSITTGSGADSIEAGDNDDVVSSGNGNDIVFGGTGNDSITLSGGDDQADGGSGNDNISGGTGADVLIGGVGADTLDGGGADGATDIFMYSYRNESNGLLSAIDSITGFVSGQDVIDFRYVGLDPAVQAQFAGINGAVIQFGGNAVNYGDATAAVHNGDGIVQVVFQQDERVLWVDLNDDGSLDNNDLRIKVDVASMQNSDVLNGLTMGPIHVSNGQNITGTIANDYYIIDGAGPVTINGMGGNDTVESNAAGGTVFAPGTTLNGNANNDTLILHHLDDISNVNGGGATGFETVVIANSSVRMTSAQYNGFTSINDGDATSPDTITLSTGGTVVGDADIETYVLEAASNISFSGPHDATDAPGTTGYTVVGSAGNDTITSNSGADSLAGGGGADWINGGAGADSMAGGTGNDTLVGAQDDALLSGGDDTDTLNIGAGFNDLSDGQIDTIENVVITAADLNTNLGDQTEGFNITGTAGADSITGGSGADTVAAGNGNDWVVGGAGADSLSAEDGWDTIVGAQDDALLDGGANSNQGLFSGHDRLNVGASFDDIGNGQIANVEEVVLTAAGTTLNLNNQSEAFTINGSSGDDTISGGNGADTINGNDGEDRLYGGFDTSADVISGGNGNDTLVGEDEDALLDGGANFDTLEVGAWHFHDQSDAQIVGIEAVLIAAAGQRLELESQTEGFIVTGSTGDDLIEMGSGNDTIDGSNGNDEIHGNAGADSIDGGAGNDSIYGAQNDAKLNGGPENDTLVIAGQGTFDDTTNSQIVNIEQVTLEDATNLDLTSQTEGFTVNGSGGNDTIQAAQGNDTIFGNAGDDSLDGSAGADSVDGGTGSDTLVGAQNDVLLDGGADVVGDTDVLEIGASFNDSGDGQIVRIETVLLTNGGTVLVLDQQTEALLIEGSDGNDDITSGSGDDTVVGNGGSDTLNGGAGNDELWVTDGGNATLVGGAGSDDSYKVQNGEATIELADWGTDAVPEASYLGIWPGMSATVNGTNGADLIELWSRVGNDGTLTIEAGSGDDSIYSSDGVDIINTGDGHDFVEANFGNDTIVAAGGEDEFYGMDGDDTFEFGSFIESLDTVNGGVGSDTLNASNLNGNWADGVVNVEVINFLSNNNFADDLTTANTLVAAGQTITINLTGTGGGDDFTIGGSAETDGHFVINGSAQDDDLTGGSLADTLIGNAGNDSLYGGGGNDSLRGGEGSDLIVGGAGADAVNLTETTSAADTVELDMSVAPSGTAANADTVTGFNLANDVIDVNQVGSLISLNAFFTGIDLPATVVNGTVIEIQSSGTTHTVSNLQDVGNAGEVEQLIAYAIANAAPGASALTTADFLTVMLYDASGNAGVYRVDLTALDGDLGTEDFAIDLVGVINGVGINGLTDPNVG